MELTFVSVWQFLWTCANRYSPTMWPLTSGGVCREVSSGQEMPKAHIHLPACHFLLSNCSTWVSHPLLMSSERKETSCEMATGWNVTGGLWNSHTKGRCTKKKTLHTQESNSNTKRKFYKKLEQTRAGRWRWLDVRTLVNVHAPTCVDGGGMRWWLACRW